MSDHAATEKESLAIAVLTVSDTRTPDNDSSGDYLAEALKEDSHHLVDRTILPDDIYQLRARVSQWIADPGVQVILVTGGTGMTERDSTPEALQPLFDKTVDGFGELFRYLSLADIGTSTVQSRALAGLANRTMIFCMPGSTGACRLAWTEILHEQLDSTHRPCNFATQVQRLG